MSSEHRDQSTKRQTALHQAMLTFWEKGVNNTSYPDLVETTGLSRKALYGYWPEKRSLVINSLDAYNNDVLTPLRDLLLPPGRQSLELFWSVLESSFSQPGWNGCLLFRSASGDLRGDKDILLRLDAHLELLSQRLVDAIQAAQKQNQLDAKIDAHRAALQICGLAVYLSIIGSNEGYSQRAKDILIEAKRSSGII